MKITITENQKSLLRIALRDEKYDIEKGVQFLNKLLSLGIADILLSVTPTILLFSDSVSSDVFAITYIAKNLGLPLLAEQHYALALVIGARL